jgi:Na+-transporting methylmalonyl-CoA/oxaloacetate decarboxylase gamma subunit
MLVNLMGLGIIFLAIALLISYVLIWVLSKQLERASVKIKNLEIQVDALIDLIDEDITVL